MPANAASESVISDLPQSADRFPNGTVMLAKKVGDALETPRNCDQPGQLQHRVHVRLLDKTLDDAARREIQHRLGRARRDDSGIAIAGKAGALINREEANRPDLDPALRDHAVPR